MKILITGFDPFGGEPVNPAFEAVKLMKDEIAGAQIVKLEIPTVFGDSIEKVHAVMVAEKPDVVLSVSALPPSGGRSTCPMPEFLTTKAISLWMLRFLKTVRPAI